MIVPPFPSLTSTVTLVLPTEFAEIVNNVPERLVAAVSEFEPEIITYVNGSPLGSTNTVFKSTVVITPSLVSKTDKPGLDSGGRFATGVEPVTLKVITGSSGSLL